MRRALALAERGRGRTQPEPDRGRGGRARRARGGRGLAPRRWARRTPRSRRWRAAGARARGRHAVRDARAVRAHGTHAAVRRRDRSRPGIRRCVVAIARPAPDRERTRAAARCARRASASRSGLLRGEARRALGGYWLAHTRGRPRVTWKVGDDARRPHRRPRAGARAGSPVAEARARGAPAARARPTRCVVGAGTARADDPRLTARGGSRARAQPLRVVCDTAARAAARRCGCSAAPLARGTVVACGADAPRARAPRRSSARGVAVWRLPAGARRRVAARAGAPARRARAVTRCCSRAAPRLGTRVAPRAGWWTASRCSPRRALLGAGGLAWCGALGARAARARGRVGSSQRARWATTRSLVIELEALMFTGLVEAVGRDRAHRGARRRAGGCGSRRRRVLDGRARRRQHRGQRLLPHRGRGRARRASRSTPCPRRSRARRSASWRAGDAVNLERALRLDAAPRRPPGAGPRRRRRARCARCGRGRGAARDASSCPRALAPLRRREGLDRGRRREPHGGRVRATGCEVALIPHTLDVTVGRDYAPGTRGEPRSGSDRALPRAPARRSRSRRSDERRR